MFSRPVSNTDYPALEKVSESAIKEKQKFERLVVSKANLLEMFNVRRKIFVSLILLTTFDSIINTSNTSSRRKFRMAALPRCIAVAP
jgi:hypothetical protein